jgi:Leucine-rich repeat (LRR) protein
MKTVKQIFLVVAILSCVTTLDAWRYVIDDVWWEDGVVNFHSSVNTEYLTKVLNFFISRNPRIVIKELHLGSGVVTELPPEIGEFTELEVLALAGNKLKTLPPAIGKLRKLEQLYVGYNKLETLPREIYFLEKLTTLFINDNPLPTLPGQIGNLKSLEMFYYSGNKESKRDLPRELLDRERVIITVKEREKQQRRR